MNWSETIPILMVFLICMELRVAKLEGRLPWRRGETSRPPQGVGGLARTNVKENITICGTCMAANGRCICRQLRIPPSGVQRGERR